MCGRTVPGRKAVTRVVVVVEGECELLDAVLAIEPSRRGPHLLHRGEHEPDQDRDDRDDDEELDEGEGRFIFSGAHHLSLAMGLQHR